ATAAAPAPKPQSAASPSASPAVAAAPSPSPAPVRAAAGKQMYQYDAQHTGRTLYAGPRQPAILRRFDTSTPDNLPTDSASRRADFQSSSAIGTDGTIYIANFSGVLIALRDSASVRDQL